MTATTHNTPYRELTDEHSVLLWQTCAYADEIVDTAHSRRPLTPAFDTMLDFLHHRLLPYLSAEERQLSGSELRDEHLTQVLLTDHNRIRTDVENVEAARTRPLLTMSTAALVSRLDRHVQREETWVTDTDLHQRATDGAAAPAAWALPLLLAAEIDLDALPHDTCDRLVLTRLQRMRRGETLRLHADHDLHRLWQRLHTLTPGDHGWVYELDGPNHWVAQITRRDLESA
jgi:uncharacterized protein (DUF2249 family)